MSIISAMKVTKLLHTRMRVSDMEQTVNFYTNVLGLEVLERKVSPRGSHLAFLKVPNSEELIELTSFPPSGPVKVQEDLVHLAFQVENLDDSIARKLPLAAASFSSMPRMGMKSNSSNVPLA
jgi:lactoylglutathione lyase